MKKHPAKKKKLSKVPLILSLAILAGLVICYFVFPAFKAGINEAFSVVTSEDEAEIQAWVKHFGAWGPIVIVAAMVAQMFMLIIPNLLLFIIAIICYGPIWGGLLCLTGVFLSSTIGYAIGKKLGPHTVDKFVSKKNQKKIGLFVDRYGGKAIFIARLSSFSSDALSFVGGILNMSYRKYILATLAGVTPVIVLITIYGESGKIEKALIWIAGVSLVIFIVYIIIDRRRQGKGKRK